MQARIVGRVTALALGVSALAGACSSSSTGPSADQRALANAQGGKGGMISVFVAGDSTVTDSSSAMPIARAVVQLFSTDTGSSALATDSTGKDGKVQFTHVKAGKYLLFVTPPAGSPYGGDTVSVTTTGSGTVNVKDILHPAPCCTTVNAIAGTVLGDSVAGDTSGWNPVAGAVVTLTLSDSTGHTRVLGVDTTSAGGGYQFSGVPAGYYTLSAVPPAGSPYASASVSVTYPGSGVLGQYINLPLKSK